MRKFFKVLKGLIRAFLIWFLLTFLFFVIDSFFHLSERSAIFPALFVLIPVIVAIWKPSKRIIKWVLSISSEIAQRNRRPPQPPPPDPPQPPPSPPIRTTLTRVDSMDGHEFEHFTADLLRRLGYQNVEVTRGSGDQGVDVLAEKDGIRYAIQCKCYSSDLGNKPVQEVNTGKVIYRCHVGVVITNRYFTPGAKEAASATGVLLWDRDTLQQMINNAY